MNKTEKIICAILAVVLVGYLWLEVGKTKQAVSAEEFAVVTNETQAVEVPTQPNAETIAEDVQAALPSVEIPALPAVPEKLFTLENAELKLEVSSHGAVVKKATLKRFAASSETTAEQDPVVLDFAASPLGELTGVPGLDPAAPYEIVSKDDSRLTLANSLVTRTIILEPDYSLTIEETFAGAKDGKGVRSALSLGLMRLGNSKNDLLSVDSWALFDKGNGKPGVIHHGDNGDSPLKPYLVGGLTGGCSGSKNAAGMPEKTEVTYEGSQQWVAVKNRFFVTALTASDRRNDGFVSTVARQLEAAEYRPDSVAARVVFSDLPETRRSIFYVGPKKQSLLWDLGMKDVMEFGMWRWLCYPLVSILNFFHGWIPSFGVAIILLTILVRLIFWPLTHKSTVGMKKMQEIQPLMKEIQAKYKDNPQRLQQETWALYKEKQVNPMSSCLPMLIQIPIFIALFNVLRSAVELRYASFLWIADLSEPEALFASWFPFGGLNILPILMALTTGLQSYFTPSTGDNQQQKMMMIFMPIMMLVMFYSFPAALSLYWFLSNLFSIVQMAIIRRQTKKA